jgi:hypothetical protein
MAVRDELQRMVAELQTRRDELAVKLNLAGKDARDEFAELEKKLEHLRARAAVVGHEAGDAADDVGEAAKLLVAELKKGYARIRALV